MRKIQQLLLVALLFVVGIYILQFSSVTAGIQTTMELVGDNEYQCVKLTATDELATCEIDGQAQVDLTDGNPINLFIVTLADLETGGGEVSYSVHAGDGTDSQAYSSKMQWTAVGDGTSVLGNITSPITFDSTIVTAGGGTLAPQGGATNGWAFTDNSDNTGTFSLQMNTSLASTTFFHARFLIIEHSDGSLIPQ